MCVTANRPPEIERRSILINFPLYPRTAELQRDHHENPGVRRLRLRQVNCFSHIFIFQGENSISAHRTRLEAPSFL